jgi:hypothetical protein
MLASAQPGRHGESDRNWRFVLSCPRPSCSRTMVLRPPWRYPSIDNLTAGYGTLGFDPGRRRPYAVDGLAISSQSASSLVGENFPISNRGVSYAVFFWAAFTLAHRARRTAAIFLRAAADIVFFLDMVTKFCFCLPVPGTFAQRARCAAAIRPPCGRRQTAASSSPSR